MAINKVVNKSTSSHGAMRNVLEYILRDEKIKEGYVEIAGPYSGETINYDDVYRTWLDEKQTWNKDSGRMYSHNIISFHKDENVSPEVVLEIGKAFSDKFFHDYQYVIGVHQDKDHLHCHIVTNSVSYIDGHKLHQTKRDLERQKEFTNTLCREMGLSIAEKGHHFDGSFIEEGEITAWSKDKYNLLINDSKKSFVADCAIAIMESVPRSTCREDFISHMAEKGWTVHWEESRKHIVFQNENGDKVRDTNIEKTFAGMKVTKEALNNEFERQNERFIGDSAESEFKHYYDELESAVIGITGSGAGGSHSETEGEDTDSLLRELDSEERASGEKRDHSIAERADRDAEQSRLSAEREQAVRAEQQRLAEESAKRRRRRKSQDLSL